MKYLIKIILKSVLCFAIGTSGLNAYEYSDEELSKMKWTPMSIDKEALPLLIPDNVGEIFQMETENGFKDVTYYGIQRGTGTSKDNPPKHMFVDIPKSPMKLPDIPIMLEEKTVGQGSFFPKISFVKHHEVAKEASKYGAVHGFANAVIYNKDMAEKMMEARNKLRKRAKELKEAQQDYRDSVTSELGAVQSHITSGLTTLDVDLELVLKDVNFDLDISPEEVKFESTDLEFVEEASRLYSEFYNLNPRDEVTYTAKEVGLQSVVAADKANVAGDLKLRDVFLDIGSVMWDIANNVVPMFGIYSDAMDAITGLDSNTGEELSTRERVVAAGSFAIAIASVGRSKNVQKAIKALVKLGQKAAKSKKLKAFTKQASSWTYKSINRTRRIMEKFKLDRGGAQRYYEDLSSPEVRRHILKGDTKWHTGGHSYPGLKGKTLFPKNWSDNKIMDSISDIATDPNLPWKVNKKTKGFQRYSAIGKRNGIDIKVIVEPKGKGIVTGYPIPHKGIKRGE